MPFIPHTEEDIRIMLGSIQANSILDLFDEIPKSLLVSDLPEIPEGLNEMSLTRRMQERAAQDEVRLNFIGAGAYEHHIPAAVWEIAGRGEWMTSYTPYQAEASQGTLQLLYEYQTMMSRLMCMEVSNASLYDGASALAESVLMAVRLQPQHKHQIWIPKTVHPLYRHAVQSIVHAQNIEMIEIPYDPKTGTLHLKTLHSLDPTHVAALILPQPNFFGLLEEVDALSDFAAEKQMLVIGTVNPLSTALLKPPGEWGALGADIVCGEGQPLGIPLSSGGPYFGFLCCKKSYIRQLPGRLIGRTLDKDGKTGYTLTLQAREQHIRRAKATSNICTNQGLLVTAATIYMSLLGDSGLRRVALQAVSNTEKLRQIVSKQKGMEILFPNTPYFHEFVLRFEIPVETVIRNLSKQGIQAGFNMTSDYPELGECLLIAVTETKTEEDLNTFAHALTACIQHEASVC